jgi:hypothetical protein
LCIAAKAMPGTQVLGDVAVNIFQAIQAMLREWLCALSRRCGGFFAIEAPFQRHGEPNSSGHCGDGQT